VLAQYTHSEDLVSTHDQSPRSIGSPRAPEDHSMTIAADSTAAAPVLLPLRTFLKQYSISKSEFPAASASAWRPTGDRDQPGAHGAAASANGDGIGSQVVSDQARERSSWLSGIC
jgi:hypothetical protein